MLAIAMPHAPPVTIKEQESQIQIEEGRLFAKTWAPEASDAGALAPILLFHDSLGCVDLWRSFPRNLAATTRRRVIAYDRLGFGRSDPYPGRLPFDFKIADDILGQRRRAVSQCLVVG